MSVSDVKENVIELVGEDSYNKGKRISADDVKYYDSVERGRNDLVHIFQVDSQNYYYYYDVNIATRDDKVIGYYCECKQFTKNHTCKHIAACMLKYKDMIFKDPPSPLEISNNILSLFNSAQSGIKEQVNLNIEFDFDGSNVTFRPYVGLKKLYVINTESKFNDFLGCYYNRKEYRFGVNFIFQPDKHFFCADDLKIINFLHGYKKTYYGYKTDPFELSDREFSSLLMLLSGKSFSIKGVGKIDDIKYEMPTSLNLMMDSDLYKLNIDDFDNYRFLDGNFKYVVYRHVFYVIPDDYSLILKNMYKNRLSEIIFNNDNINLFKDGLLRKIKNNIVVDDSVTDIVIAGTPLVSLYFDLLRDEVVCNIKLDYGKTVIDYFDNSNVVRDTDYEDTVLADLYAYNFSIIRKKFRLVEIDDIGYFLSEGLAVLGEKYNIFTSKKIDNMSILKKSEVRSNFSIGTDGIMSYSFDTDNIDISELGSVLDSLKKKKRYYKLKNGNIVDLENNSELKELDNIFSDLELSSRDIVDGNVVVPKYRALYIDSLKKNRYKSIKTDNSFDKFIDNFNRFKDVDITFDKLDSKILRDYQKDGVKWLYTLYKCDLGGILADEMGLGKSLQVICFIKQVLASKMDAKIMIVCPTSLVYNWKKEFDKFAPELKYVTVAESKAKRLEVMNHFDDYNIFITTYGLVRNDNDEYEKVDFEVCVIDEAQAIKNYQANMTREIKKIKAKTKLALTGTPLENSIMELWSIFDFIMPGYLNSIIKFRQNYGIKDVDKESLDKLTNLNYQISPFILRRKKADVYRDLPPKIENNIYLDLPDSQKALYVSVLKESEKEFAELVATEGFKKARFKILQLLMKLRQICIDPAILFENYSGNSIKMEKLIETVQDYISTGHKILIFSSFKMVVDRVQSMFNKNGISSYMIAGDVKSKERMELVDKFNNDDTNCFLITLKSGGTGLNLTSADVVIHLDIWWNPQVENQATDRAHRIGQTKKVSVIKFITRGTIEEKIIELQNKKKILSDNLIEGKDSSELLSSLGEKEIKSLLSYGDDE